MRTLIVFWLAFLTCGCVSLDYDLRSVPIPISAKPVCEDAGTVEEFRIEARNVLWAHGLFGHEQPDVAALIAERSAGWDRIAGFRIQQTANTSHWLLTHLTLTLVRMRKVVIVGQLVRD